MDKYVVIGLMVLAAIGILLISFVQTKIIARHGIGHFKKRGFINVYWYDRTRTERWCFWTGLILLTTPFVVAGLFATIAN